MNQIPLNNNIKIYTIFIFCITSLFVLIGFIFNQISSDRWQAQYKIRTNPEVIIYLEATQAVIIDINGEGSSPNLLKMVKTQIQSIAEMLDRKELKTSIRLSSDYLVVKLIDGGNENIDKNTRKIIDTVNEKIKVVINDRLDLYYKISEESIQEAKKIKLSQLVSFINFIETQGSVYLRKIPLEDSNKRKKKTKFELNNVVQYFMFNEPYDPGKLNDLEKIMDKESYDSLLESLRVLRWQYGNYKAPEDNNLIKLQKMTEKLINLDVVEIDFLDILINRKPGIYSSLIAGGVIGLFVSITLLYLHLAFPFQKLKKLLFSENSKRKKNSH